MLPSASRSIPAVPDALRARSRPTPLAKLALLANSVAPQLVRYALVSVIALVADVGTLYTFTQYGHVYYLASAAIGFLIGVVVNYLLSLKWVFRQRVFANSSIEFALFAGIGVVGLALNEVGMWFIKEQLGFHYLGAKAITTIAVFFWNFGARKALLFSAATAVTSEPVHALPPPVSTVVRILPGSLSKALAMGAFAYFVVAAAAVGYTRLPFVDEGVFVASSIHIVQTGLTGDPSVPPWGLGIPLPQSQVHNFWVMPGFLYSLAAWFRVFPATLHSARALSILFGIIDLVLIYQFMRALSRSTALVVLSLALLATDFNMIMRVAMARMDSMSLALNFASWLAYIHLRRRSLPWAVGAGCLIGSLSLLIHPNGIFAFAGLIVLGFAIDRPQISWRSLGAAVIGSAVPLVLLIPLYLRAPEVWRAQMGNHSQGRFISFLHPLEALDLEFRKRYFGQFGGTDPFEFSPKALLLLVLVAYACAVIFALVTFRRRRRLEIISLIVFGITAIYFTFFEAGHFFPYNIHLLPWFCILLAGALFQLARAHPRGGDRGLRLGHVRQHRGYGRLHS